MDEISVATHDMMNDGIVQNIEIALLPQVLQDNDLFSNINSINYMETPLELNITGYTHDVLHISLPELASVNFVDNGEINVESVVVSDTSVIIEESSVEIGVPEVDNFGLCVNEDERDSDALYDIDTAARCAHYRTSQNAKYKCCNLCFYETLDISMMQSHLLHNHFIETFIESKNQISDEYNVGGVHSETNQVLAPGAHNILSCEHSKGLSGNAFSDDIVANSLLNAQIALSSTNHYTRCKKNVAKGSLCPSSGSTNSAKSIIPSLKNVVAAIKIIDSKSQTSKNTKESKSSIVKRIYRCAKCNLTFKSYLVHSKHMKKYHPSETKQRFQCPHCKFAAQFEKNLRLHIQRLHKKASYQCEKCDFKSNDNKKYQKHILRMHTKRFKCSLCPYKARKKYCVSHHMNTVHNNQKEFECTECSYKTNYKKHLTRHVNTVHLNLKPNCCPLCDYTAAQKQKLDNHIMEKHTSHRPYSCDQCSYKTILQNRLKSHKEQVHLKVRNHICLACNSKFYNKSHLMKHMETHKDFGVTSIKCNICNHKSYSHETLQRHIQKAHLSQKRTFKCKQCPYQCESRPTLKNHMESAHVGFIPFDCDNCIYSTTSKQNLDRHLRRNHNEETYFEI